MTDKLIRFSAWATLGSVIFVTVSPIGLRPHDVLPVNFDRAAAFALMAILFVVAYPKHWFLVAIAIVFGAGCIELLQEISPTRHANLNDAIIKAFGASLGVLGGRTINAVRAPGLPPEKWSFLKYGL